MNISCIAGKQTKSRFQKIREEKEQKKKEEEEEAAKVNILNIWMLKIHVSSQVFESFVRSFETEEDSSKSFIREGQLNPNIPVYRDMPGTFNHVDRNEASRRGIPVEMEKLKVCNLIFC